MSNIRKWILPVQLGTARHEYKYDEVDYKTVDRCDPAVSKKALPLKFFKPLKKKTTLDFSTIASKSSPAWPTFNAQSLSIQIGDFEALRLMHESGAWATLSSGWLSLVCPAGHMFRRCGTLAWYYSLGPVGTNALVGWPATKTTAPNGTSDFFFPKMEGMTSDNLQFFCITDLDNFEALDLEWCGPLAQSLRKAEKPGSFPDSLHGVVAKPKGPALTLSRYVAMKAFFNLGPVWLRRLAGHYLVDLAAGASLYEILTTLVRKFVPGISDEKLLEVLGARVQKHDDEDGAVDEAVLTETIDISDLKTFDEVDKSESLKKGTVEKEFMTEYRALRRKVRPPAVAKEAAKKKGGKKAAAAAIGLIELPVFGEFDALSQEQARPYMPADMSFGKDMRNKRWWARDEPFSVSRSFVKYGEVTAFSLVCVAAYRFQGLECPFPWIVKFATGVRE